MAELIGASSGIGHMVTDSQALLVTADERYWRAARRVERIVRLADFATLR